MAGKISKWVRNRAAQLFLVIEAAVNGPVIFDLWSPNAEQLAWAHTLPVLIVTLFFLSPTEDG